MARKIAVDFEIRSNGAKTIKNVEDQVKTLRKEWRNAEDAATRYSKKVELEKANAELSRHRKLVAEVGSSWDNFKKNFSSIAPGVMGGNLMAKGVEIGVGLLTQFIALVPEFIGGAAKIDDALADIMKTTGLSKSEVKELNEELKNLDTRTSMEQLHKLAMEAGKLGKDSLDDVLAFVRAADKLNVALGEDLGADAITQIGKITQTFDMDELYGAEQAMLKVGSAVNVLGANSTANEKNIVNFTFRTQGLGAAVNLASGDLMGMAATLDIAGQGMETSATVVNKLFVAMGQDVPKFAKLAKMGVKDFAHLLQTDANEALIRVLENVKGNNTGLLGMANILQKLGLDGQESVSVVSALANSTDTLRTQQDLANKAIADGTSILDEFNTKNNTTAGILEKISKWWDNIKNSGADFWNGITKWFGVFVGAVSALDLEIAKTAEDIANLEAKNKDLAKTEKNLNGLLTRYEELKGKTKLNKDEQNELKKVVGEIAGIVPSAVTELDKYGKALDINSGKAKEYIKIQKDFLKVQNAQQIKATENELKDLKKTLELTIKARREDTKVVEGYNLGGGWKRVDKKKQADYKAEDEAIAKLNQDIEMKSNYLKVLNGDYQEALAGETVKAKAKTEDENKGGKGGFGPGNLGKGAETEQQKSLKREQDYQRELRKIRNVAEADMLSDKEEELSKIKFNNQERRDLAKGHSSEIIAINELEKAQINAVNAKYEAKANEAMMKFHEDQRREQMTAQEKEVVQVMDKYEKLLEVAGTNEEKIKEITAAEAAEIEAIRRKYAFQGIDIISQSLNELERLKNEAGLAVDTQVMAGALDPQAANIKKLEAEQEYLGAQYLLYATYGEERLDLAEAWMEKENELNFQRAAYSKRLDDELMDSTYSLKIARINALKDGVATLRGFVKQTSGLYKALFLAEKALAISQVIIMGIKERQAIRTKYSAIPGGTLIGIIEQATSYAQTAAAVAQIGSQIFSEIAMKKEGGFTDMETMYGAPSGFVASPTLFAIGNRSYVAGEAGKEFVLNNTSLQNPVVANFANMMDVVQKTGDYSMLQNQNPGNEQMAAHLVALRGDMQLLIKAVQTNSKRPIEFNYKAFKNFEDELEFIYKSVSG